MKTQVQIQKVAARYPRLIEWSAEDKCFVGSAPPLIGHCCHGKSEEEVAKQLAVIVADLVADGLEGKMPLPDAPPKTYSGKFMLRITPGLHKKLALQAGARGDSLNTYIEKKLVRA